MGSSPREVTPSPIPSENLSAWFRFNTRITVTGSGVSQWDDVSGNDRHLVQANDANRPAKQVDGSILFNGTSHRLTTGAFTRNQPDTIYLLLKQISWTSGDRLMDGISPGFGQIIQTAVSPELRMGAGSLLPVNNQLVLDTYGVICCVFNAENALMQIDNGVPVTGDDGANNPGGLNLGTTASGSNAANIQVKEVIIYSAAHDDTTRATIIDYLSGL